MACKTKKKSGKKSGKKFNAQDNEACDYCGQRPAIFPVAGVVLCRECYARIVNHSLESDEQKPESEG